MKLIKKQILLLVYLFSNSLYATTYYVDATNGNDANSGITPQLAWQNISRVNSQSFIPGDSILFKRNEIFRGKLVPDHSGSAGNPIVYAAYGEGDNPQLLGSQELTGWVLHSGNVYIKSNLNLPHFAGDGLFEFDTNDPFVLTEDNAIPTIAGHYYYDENLNNGTIYIYCSDGLAPSNHHIEVSTNIEIISVHNQSHLSFLNLSLKFGDCKNMLFYSTDYITISHVNSSYQGHYGNPNIFFLGSNHVLIEDCVLYKSYNSGITFYPIGTTRLGNYNIVRGCTITKVATNDGIGIHSDSSGNRPGDYHILENNIISECDEGSIDIGGEYHIVRNNSCFSNGEDGIQLSGSHLIIENNLCYNNTRHGIISFSDDEGGNIVRNNIIYDNIKYGLMSGDKPLAIYNNTICNSQTRNEVYFGYYNNPIGVTYKNNIVYNDNDYSTVRVANGLPSNIEMSNNNYVVTNASIYYVDQTGLHYTLAEIQNNFNTELNSFMANPAFVGAVNNDYHLNANSPCIDTGTFLTQTTSSGSGMQIPVSDVRYFCDGFGIATGDTIQLQGQTQELTITNIDVANNIITVNQTVSWNDNDGVSLVYNGLSPDVGAYEYNSISSIDEYVENNRIKIFPNPVMKSIHFSSNVVNKYFQIISQNGVIVKSGLIDKSNLNLQELSKGIYFLKLMNNANKAKTFKFIKK